MKDKKNILYRAGAIVIALALWQIAAMTTSMEILLVSPVKVIARLFTIWTEEGFLGTVIFSLLRIASGFLIAVILGFVLAVVAGKFKPVEYLLWPYVVTFKAVPVASFIIMCLIWLSYNQLTVFISFLIVFPVIYSNVLTGYKNTDEGLLEMARVFRLPYNKRFKYIYMPGIRPYFESACSISVGMAFKAGVAAEVIGVVGGSIGERLYEAKIYFQSADLFAWTIIIIIMSVLLEKLFSLIIRKLFNLMAKSRSHDFAEGAGRVCADMVSHGTNPELVGITKRFGDKQVLNNLSLSFPSGQITCLNGPSGVGKTTLFRIISGLIKPDSGTVIGLPQDGRIGYVFQEDRLCEEFSVIENIALVGGNCSGKDKIMEHLAMLGLTDDADRKVSELSGGMKRRVAIARAICYDAPMLLLDEPFKGLDAKLKDSVIEYVLEETKGKTVIIITHDPSESEMMGVDSVIEI